MRKNGHGHNSERVDDAQLAPASNSAFLSVSKTGMIGIGCDRHFSYVKYRRHGYNDREIPAVTVQYDYLMSLRDNSLSS